MKLFDVNILVYAHRADTRRHRAVREWFEAEVNGSSAFGMTDLVVSGFLRIVTSRRIFVDPTPIELAVDEVRRLMDRPNRVRVCPGRRHFEIFLKLCEETSAKGTLVADAYLAALAIEHGSEWISFDRDFGRFANLNWSMPPNHLQD